MTAESSLRERILKTIHQDYPPRRSGVLVFGRPASGSTGGGHPDLFGVALGRFFALEIKMPGISNKPTPLQEQRIRDLRTCGACAWIVRSPLDATRAIYQVKQGIAVMPEEPLDFDDWLKGLDLQGQSEAQAVPAASAIENAALDAGLTVEQATGPAFDFEPSPAPAMSASATLDAMLEADINEAPASVAANAALADVELPPPPVPASPRPTVDDLQEARDAGLLGADEPEPVKREGVGLHLAITNVQADVRAVGDRVTETWEMQNRLNVQQRTTFQLLIGLANEVLILREQMNALLKEIDVADAVKPVEFALPTPLDDVLPPSDGEAPAPAERIRRRRKAS